MTSIGLGGGAGGPGAGGPATWDKNKLEMGMSTNACIRALQTRALHHVCTVKNLPCLGLCPGAIGEPISAGETAIKILWGVRVAE